MSKEKAKQFLIKTIKEKPFDWPDNTDARFDQSVFTADFVIAAMEAYADQKVLDFVAEKIEKGEAYVSEVSFGAPNTNDAATFDFTFDYKEGKIKQV